MENELYYYPRKSLECTSERRWHQAERCMSIALLTRTLTSGLVELRLLSPTNPFVTLLTAQNLELSAWMQSQTIVFSSLSLISPISLLLPHSYLESAISHPHPHLTSHSHTSWFPRSRPFIRMQIALRITRVYLL